MGGVLPVKWTPRMGGLNSNFGYEDIRDGDLVSARNVRSLGGDINDSPDYIPIKGNAYEFEPETPVVQNQILRIYITGNGIAFSYAFTWKLVDVNGNQICTFTQAVVGNDFAGTAAALAVQFTAFLPAGFTYSWTPTAIDTNSGYIDFELLNIPGYVSPTGFSWNLITTTIFSQVTVRSVVIQEAVDASMIGNWNDIGSFDMLGDDFIFWTTRKGLPIQINVTGCADDGTGLIKLTVAAHNIAPGEAIRVAFVTGTNGLEMASTGTFIVSAITAGTITLAASVFPGGAVYASGGIIYQNILALSEIGVAVEDINADVINYTRLLRSWRLNFRAIKQQDITGDLQSFYKNLYYTDDYNNPRAFYYKGAYITDGAINFVNPDGIYFYDTISDVSRLFLNGTGQAHLLFIGQTQTGGNLRAGNKDYYFRFLTENFSAGEWSDPTNPINTYTESTAGDPLLLRGNEEGARTGKINNLLLINIPPNRFKYVELAVVEYIGLSFYCYLIKRDVLLGEATQVIQHSGFENNTEELDPGTLNLKYANISTARNISILNGRLILSDLTYNQVYDFTRWAQTFRHSVEKTTILGVGSEVSAGGTPTYRYGEYYDPGLVNSGVGYCMNDTYRYSVKLKLKPKYGGGTTLNFWVDDIRIDCEATNVTTPNRRDAPVTPTDYDLTTPYAVGSEPDPYVWYVDFHGFSLDYLIDGIPVRELVESIIVERSVRIPEILGTGYVVPAVGKYLEDIPAGPARNVFSYDPTPFITQDFIGEFPFISGFTNVALNNPTYIQATSGVSYFNPFSPELRYGSFYWIDNQYGMANIDLLPGDGLLVFGNPEKQAGFFPTNLAGGYDNQYAVYNGATGALTVKPTLNTILEAYNLAIGTDVTFTTTRRYSKKFLMNPTPAGVGLEGEAVYQKGIVANFNVDLPDGGYGFNIAQYYRALSDYANYNPDTCKYGQRINSKYIPTGAYLDIFPNTPSTVTAGTLKVLGGDVFIQKTFFKFRYPYTSPTIPTTDLGFGGGIAFYSINTINSQMRYKQPSYTNPIYPKETLLKWLQAVGNPDLDPALNYNFGYNIRNAINKNAAFNPLIEDNLDLGATFIWSDQKIDGSNLDGYRYFMPLNIKYLSKSDGDIAHHTTSNGELLSYQARRIMRQFFETTGILSTKDGSEVILGDGAVMARPGQTLSTFGSRHKWSHIKGKTQGGHDVDYIFDIENKTILRTGLDGTVDLGLRANYSAFLSTFTRWVEGHDTPAYDWGICAVWYQKTKEAIWTFRGKRVVADFDLGDTYSVGSVVRVTDCSTWNTFEQVDDLFIALANLPANTNPETDTAFWRRLTIDEPEYFSYFTLVWSEIKNKFQCHHGYHPNIYNKMKNYFLTPRPVGNTGKVYRHERGNYCEWYDDGTTKQTDVFNFEAVINANPEISKDALSLMVEGYSVPEYTEINTNTHKTHMDSGDYTARESAWVTPVLMDQTVTAKNPTGSNKGDGSRVWGKYARVLFQGSANTYNAFKSFVLKVRVRDKTYNK